MDSCGSKNEDGRRSKALHSFCKSRRYCFRFSWGRPVLPSAWTGGERSWRCTSQRGAPRQARQRTLVPSLLGHPYPESYTPRRNHGVLLPWTEETPTIRIGNQPLPLFLVADLGLGANSGLSAPTTSPLVRVFVLLADDPVV